MLKFGSGARSRTRSAPVILDRPERIALAAIAILWLITMFTGGSARADVLYLVPLRGAAVAGLALLLLLIVPERLRLQRGVLLFTGAAALIVSVQLIPLPPSLWTALPGREVYGTLSSVPGLGDVWRPISLSPDLTWNALLSLLPPLFYLVAVGALTRIPRRWLLLGLLGTILFSGFTGLLQIAGGPDSPLRHYQYTNRDSAVGLFANRNHQAVFLAMGIPVAAWWGLLDSGSIRRGGRLAIAAAMVLFLLTASVTTESRMGAVIVLLSLILSLVYVLRHTGLSRAGTRWLAAAGLVTLSLGAAAFGTWSDSRMVAATVADDLRIRILPESIEAARTFFPVGAGFGAFPDIFPRFEAVEDLKPTYVNHTHSELTQIVIEGGAAAILVLLVFLGWFFRASWHAWATPKNSALPGAEARLCSVIMVLPLVASITDYPLRTPLMACSFAATVAILSSFMRGRRSSAKTGSSGHFS